MVSVALVLMNTYFLMASQDMIFASKTTFAHGQAAIIETALGDFDSLTIENVRQVMQRLDISGVTYVTVSGPRGNVLYDTTVTPAMDVEFVEEYTQRARDGYSVHYTSFSGGAFHSAVFLPITRGGAVTGTVYIYERDAEQGAILLGLQNAIQRITLIIISMSVMLIAFILWTVTRRMTSIVRAIESVRAGEYTYQIKVSGRDEIAVLAGEFNDLTRRLRETEDVRRRFVADASHELKTPLAAIRLLADSILQNEDIMRETALEFVADIGDEAERLARTTEKLMALTRMDSGVAEERVRVDLRRSVLKALHTLAPLAERESVSLGDDLEEGCAVRASEDGIHRAVFNIVENAIKYNIPGGHVDVRLRRAGDTAELTVEDTGIGVPEEDLPHIFDRFYRVDKARSQAAGGSGLGLSIARDAVLEYGGELEASRREGGGMTFALRLPLDL